MIIVAILVLGSNVYQLRKTHCYHTLSCYHRQHITDNCKTSCKAPAQTSTHHSWSTPSVSAHLRGTEAPQNTTNEIALHKFGYDSQYKTGSHTTCKHASHLTSRNCYPYCLSSPSASSPYLHKKISSMSNMMKSETMYDVFVGSVWYSTGSNNDDDPDDIWSSFIGWETLVWVPA